jgi:hypothetical protein
MDLLKLMYQPVVKLRLRSVGHHGLPAGVGFAPLLFRSPQGAEIDQFHDALWALPHRPLSEGFAHGQETFFVQGRRRCVYVTNKIREAAEVAAGLSRTFESGRTDTAGTRRRGCHAKQI